MRELSVTRFPPCSGCPLSTKQHAVRSLSAVITQASDVPTRYPRCSAVTFWYIMLCSMWQCFRWSGSSQRTEQRYPAVQVHMSKGGKCPCILNLICIYKRVVRLTVLSLSPLGRMLCAERACCVVADGMELPVCVVSHSRPSCFQVGTQVAALWSNLRCLEPCLSTS